MDGMYPVDGQKHAWAGHSCGAVKDNALFFPYASPSGKAEGSADTRNIFGVVEATLLSLNTTA